MSKALHTEAYLPFHSNQEWASDPDFAVICIDEKLARLVEQGIVHLKDSPFSLIRSTHSPDYDFVALDDDMNGCEPFEPEYSVVAPDVMISRYVTFVFDFKHTGEEGWCEMSFEQLSAYLDKAWVESYGYIFVQIPAEEGSEEGRWLCIDPLDGEEGYCVECVTLNGCIEAASSWLEDTVDSEMEGFVPRPSFNYPQDHAFAMAA